MHPMLFISGHRVNTDNLKLKSTRGKKTQKQKKTALTLRTCPHCRETKLAYIYVFTATLLAFRALTCRGLSLSDQREHQLTAQENKTLCKNALFEYKIWKELEVNGLVQVKSKAHSWSPQLGRWCNFALPTSAERNLAESAYLVEVFWRSAARLSAGLNLTVTGGHKTE